MKLVFLGSADFGLPALRKLKDAHTVCAVVTTPPRPQGRGLRLRESPVAQFAQQNGLGPVFTPENLRSPDFLATLADCGADIFVVVAFRILPRALFSLPRLGTVNIHAALLPKYRGPAPIQRAIEAGERETGVTVFRIDDGVDTGDILLQKSLPIGPRETAAELYARLSDLGAETLIETLNAMTNGNIGPVVRDNSLACGAPKLSKEEALIDWKRPADAIFNKLRAFKPFPGTYALLSGKRLGIEWAEPVDGEHRAEPGTIVRIADESFDVACSPGVLRVLSVKPEGRKSMNVQAFLLGNILKEGTILC